MTRMVRALSAIAVAAAVAVGIAAPSGEPSWDSVAADSLTAGEPAWEAGPASPREPSWEVAPSDSGEPSWERSKDLTAVAAA
ncbi:hypothetical protein ACFPM3_12415 [Streptomyces coeruleoprunus]|uniref:Uncharacterized protein n=1 Tax=Streptomyces coeruleoprunus TaxID=285563 RepID=A0ABV9XER5_9ACTN